MAQSENKTDSIGRSMEVLSGKRNPAAEAELDDISKEIYRSTGLKPAALIKDQLKKDSWKDFVGDKSIARWLKTPPASFFVRMSVERAAVNQYAETHPEIKNERTMRQHLKNLNAKERFAYMDKAEGFHDSEISKKCDKLWRNIDKDRASAEKAKNDILDKIENAGTLEQSIANAEKEIIQIEKAFRESAVYGVDVPKQINMPSGNTLAIAFDYDKNTVFMGIEDTNGNRTVFNMSVKEEREKLFYRIPLEGGLSKSRAVKEEFNNIQQQSKMFEKLINNEISKIDSCNANAAEKAMMLLAEMNKQYHWMNSPALDPVVIDFESNDGIKDHRFTATYTPGKDGMELKIKGPDGREFGLREGVDNRALLEAHGMAGIGHCNIIDAARSENTAMKMLNEIATVKDTDKDIVVFTTDGIDKNGDIYPCSYAAEKVLDDSGQPVPGKYMVHDYTDPTNVITLGTVDLSGDLNSERNISTMARAAKHAHSLCMAAHSKKNIIEKFKALVKDEITKQGKDLAKEGTVITLKAGANKWVPIAVKEGANGELDIQAHGKPVSALAVAVKLVTPSIITKTVEHSALKKSVREICDLGGKNWQEWMAKQVEPLCVPDENGVKKDKVEISLCGVRADTTMKISFNDKTDKFIVDITREVNGKSISAKEELTLDQLIGKDLLTGSKDNRKAAEILNEVNQNGYYACRTAAKLQKFSIKREANLLTVAALTAIKNAAEKGLNGVLETAAKKAQEANEKIAPVNPNRNTPGERE